MKFVENIKYYFDKSLKQLFKHFFIWILVPGHPQDVKVTAINSTAIFVSWKPPAEKNRNGVIRGYHIHVQETKEDVSCNFTKVLEILILYCHFI